VTLDTNQQSGKDQGCLFVISGPSGVGKGTLVSAALAELPDLALSISATTRAPRPGDVEGVSYHFISDDAFDALIANDALLEWAEVHGNRYGTPTDKVRAALDEGRDLILEIDMQGFEQVRQRMPEACGIFIAPPSLEELKRRLEHRATESAETIERRLGAAEMEMQAQERYNAVIVNDDLDRATQELLGIIRSHHGSRTSP